MIGKKSIDKITSFYDPYFTVWFPISNLAGVFFFNTISENEGGEVKGQLNFFRKIARFGNITHP